MTDTVTMEEKHSNRGASAAHRWMNCTASPLLIEKRRKAMTDTERERFDSKTSVYAEEGSAAHALAEAALNHVFTNSIGSREVISSVPDLVGTVLAKGRDENYRIVGRNPFDGETTEIPKISSDFVFTCDEEMRDGVMLYVNTIAGIVDSSESEETHVAVESRTYPLGEGMDSVFGTADCIVSSPEEIWVIDFKYGRREVHAIDNPQALFYAAGAINEVGGGPDTRVNIIIVQPRVEFADGRSISDWTISGAELMEWRDEDLRPAIDLTFDPLSVRYRMGDYCGFCPVAASCPLLQKTSIQASKDAFAEDVISLPYEEAARVDLILPSETSDSGISAALKLTVALDLWSKKVKELASDRALSGNTIPGFKLVRKRANRKWKDEHKTTQALRAALSHEDWEEAFTRKLKSPAQLEKAGFQELVDELSHKPQGGLTVVHETDRRPATESVNDDWLNEPVE